MNVVKLPPGVCPTEGEFDSSIPVGEAHEAGVTVGLEQALESFQMAGWMLTLPILAVNVGRHRMAGPAPRPGIDRITPEPSGLRLSPARIEHRQSRVVGEHVRRRQH